jgi:hypothetical protein
MTDIKNISILTYRPIYETTSIFLQNNKKISSSKN